MSPEKSIFSKIIDREIPATFIHEDEKCIVINDINPKARVHLLIIPKKPIATLFDLTPDDKDVMGHMMLLLPQIAQSQGLDGFKTQINTGESGGQEVFHIHIHLLGQ
ncbi:histidine triad nucleotide-binding protein [Thiomicrorhabdus aquaedulcis]|uniref:histidine triad nucleotide-binding protein n=1 Tax=Thiomicrorhabdus aquaedulcis TaxID=2211106 RepID=UPI000FD9FD54|nr:histidine triad nucleotide-binding protein [Thiomicrorhabdus aquaedulcis]